jgi:hypothetical protein
MNYGEANPDTIMESTDDSGDLHEPGDLLTDLDSTVQISDPTGEDVTPDEDINTFEEEIIDAILPEEISDLNEDPGPFHCNEEDHPNPNLSLVEELFSASCLPGMVLIDTFCMDAYEPFLEGWSPYYPPASPTPPSRSVRGAVPQGHISGVQAQEACIAANKRLCSISEWEQACRGNETRTYPYGHIRVNGLCNDSRESHPVVEYFGTTDSWIWSELNHPCINQLPDSLALTGDHPECVTPEGVFDMMGNLHEWVSAPEGIFRGGFYVDTQINGEGCLYQTTAHSFVHYDYSTGFRCCADRL